MPKTFLQIQSQVAENIIDQNVEVLGNIPEYVNDAVRKATERHNFRGMKATAGTGGVFQTTQGDHVLGAIPTLWKERRGRPLRVDGFGKETQLDWISEAEVPKLYNRRDPTNVSSQGGPRHILEGSDGSFYVYPSPNAQSPVGPVYADGDWRIVIPYWTYFVELTGISSSNWITDNMVDFVESWATYRAMRFNRDPEWPNELSQALALLRKYVGEDKHRQVGDKFTVRPRRDRNASFTQGRMS